MKLMALIYFVLSLFGVDIGGASYVTRTTVDGTDTLYSQTTTQAGVTRFECLRSATGQCHYTVYPRDCESDGACETKPLDQFALASGDSRQVSGLAGIRLCVSNNETAPRGCGMLPAWHRSR